MRALKTLGILGISPVLQCSACRNAPLLAQQDLRPQCFPLNIASTHPLGLPKRFSPMCTSPQSSSVLAPNPTFSYRLGASFSAKGRRFNPKEDIFSFDPEHRILSKEDVNTGGPSSGQDAFFVSRVGKSGNVAFGVADGVGGWADSGIDSAQFSHGLCRHMANIARKTATGKRSIRPRTLLQDAYNEIDQEGKIEGGGSTACVAVGNRDGTLRVANLGDSGYIQLRLNAVHRFSNPQTHAFNTPFQLSIVPPKVRALNRLFGGKPFSDPPRDSNDTSFQVRHGDVLVFATDGVWDNLSRPDMLKIVSRQMTGFQAWVAGEKGITVAETIHDLTQEGGIPKQHENTLQMLLAVNIVGEAKMASVDTKRDGPFAKEVQRVYPHENYHGGKVDDICVIVAIVVENVEGDS